MLGVGLGRRSGIAGILAAVLLSALAGTAWVGSRHLARLAGYTAREWSGTAVRVGFFAGIQMLILGWNLGTLWLLPGAARFASPRRRLIACPPGLARSAYP